MRLFVVTSVYQFLNALTVQLNDKSVKSDIICVCKLLNETFDLEKLSTYEIFENVYSWSGIVDQFQTVSKNKKEHVKNIFKKVWLAIGKRKLLREMPKIDKQYDEICVGYPDYPTRFVCHNLKNKNTRCTLLEEGTYTYDFLAKKESFIKRAAFKLFIGSEVVSESTKVYVYRPEMLRLGVKEMEVAKINSELDTLGPIIKDIYRHELPNVEKIDKPFIMFDQSMQDDGINARQNQVANMLISKFGKDNVVVKLHPNYRSNPYDAEVPIYAAKCPFEILMSTLKMEEKVLISLLSTACINPKMILDVEPTVIFIIKLSGVENTAFYNPEMLKLIDRLRDSYRNPEKIYVPETFEELEQILDKIKGEKTHG